jgi:uncharacterized membrane protein YkoI
MLVLVIAAACALYGCSGNLDEKKEQKSLISVDEAKSMAFYDSGADPENTLITRRKLTEDDGPVYLICFTTWTDNRTIRYEYDIDGLSGEVKGSRKKIQSFAPAKINKNDKASEYKSGKDFIGVVKAKKLVLEDAGLDAEETEFRSIRLENRDKRALYVTEFYSMGITYMFHIDAVNGKVLSREVQFND